MKKQLYNKFDKHVVPTLPRVTFEGRIHVVLSRAQAEKAVNYLLAQPILGLDTETRPSFSKGSAHSVALLQVATHDTCFLFRLNIIGLTPALIRLLEDTTVTKVGLAWNNDLLSLRQLGEFTPGTFVDLQDMVREIGIEDQSLVKLYANLLGGHISKRERLSNWERDILSDSQKSYAAIDAWACVKMYRELCRLKETGDYELVVTDQENEEDNSKER
jgi:ribonuclease D